MNRVDQKRRFEVPLRSLLRVVSLCCGAVLIVSGLAHWKNPYAFLQTILRYELVAGVWATAVAVSLPAVNLVVGCCIVLNLARQWFLMIAGGLFAFFAFVQASAWWRGLEISCGCFSIDSGGPVVNPWTFGSVAALSCVALSVVKLQHALNRSGYAI
ncbi:MAG TPA: MauE/DoxX family redox-associated membrane protein [Pirellulaceae bacterium]|nr:MauE/DoxX family redox-associated membrane protein [Pirellulaceae bacterium]